MQPSIDHCERRISFPYRTIEGWMNGGFELCQCAARILFCVWRKAACASNSPICVFNPRDWIFNRCDWIFNPRLWGSVFRFWALNSSYIYVISIPRKMFQPFSGQSFCFDFHRKRGWRAWFLNPSARFSRGTEERAWAVELFVSVSAMLVSIHQKNIAQAFILERYFFVSIYPAAIPGTYLMVFLVVALLLCL